MTKYFYTIIIAITVLLFVSACSTVEEATETDPEEVTVQEDEDLRPDWYDFSNQSYSDSLSFAGTGLASSTDYASAEEQSSDQAIANLRFAIDQFTEKYRQELAEEGANQFESTSFILELRNAVHRLEFADHITFTTERIEEPNSVNHVYTKAVVTREKAVELISEVIGNDEFIRFLQER